MKTLEDLKALREKLKNDIKVRQNSTTKNYYRHGYLRHCCRCARSNEGCAGRAGCTPSDGCAGAADRLYRHVRKRSAGGCCAARRTAHYLRQSKTGRC